MRQIATNAGVEGSVIIERIKNSETGMGYDALHDKYVNMLKAGIVDPTKVTRSALQNAASVASTFLTTEAAVVDIPQKEAPMPGAPGMGGMELRIEDALAATKAAVEEGIVPGGGTAYVNVINKVAELKSDVADTQVGINIIVRA